MRILLAEDNAFYRRLLEATLLEWGYQVEAVADGVAAWERLQADNAPQIAILDWVMPGLDGLEVIRRVRGLARPEPTYLLVLTSKTGTENIVTALESGADDYLTKPFDREELQARLRVGRRIVGLQTSQAVIFAFARAVEAKSPYTQGHSDRVTRYSLQLADSLGLSAAELETLRRGAIVHDIGKIAVPDAILDKPGALTPEEFSVIKQHPVSGVHIVEGLHSCQDILPLIRWHHERLDGNGYPDGIRGSQIPLLVRILSVADVYDALASKRPYRPALPHGLCLAELRKNATSGGLDPDLVEHFGRLPPPSEPQITTPVPDLLEDFLPAAFGSKRSVELRPA
jgi:putative two-component system response regulator